MLSPSPARTAVLLCNGLLLLLATNTCDAFQIPPPQSSSSSLLSTSNNRLILHPSCRNDVSRTTGDTTAAAGGGNGGRSDGGGVVTATASSSWWRRGLPKKAPGGSMAATTAAMVAASLFLCTPLPSEAASYDSLSPEQKFAAEAWRMVDATYFDRTFNGLDWFQVRQDLVTPKKKYKSMEEAQTAVAGMMAGLGDKYTKYLTPAKYQSLVDSATGTLAGIGVEIATNADRIPMVSDVEPGSPAQKAGLLPNDVFLEGDGTKFDGTSTPDDVALKLRGPVGSKVGVTVLRDGTTTKDFIIQREPIKVTSVRSYMGRDKVGVIRIKSFSATTGATVKDAFAELKGKGAKTVLFDLRSNPGGLLPGGTEAASLFLKSNQPVVFVVSNKGVVDAQETFADGFDTETPLVVLVDHNTASAAEVFTAALKENGRAKVIGEQTFGKGIIQTIRELSDGNGGVAVTLARYETPQHNDINKAGIPVDVTVNVDCPKNDALACVPSSLL